jgi:CRP-like cAMP-binding protein
VRDPKMIKAHYLRTWFIYDVVSALPVDFIVFAVTAESSHPIQLIRLLKALRLFRAMKLLNNIDVRGLPGWLQLWFLIYVFVLMAHWFACVFWKIAVLEGLPNSWVSLYPDLYTAPISAQYVQCMYWAVSTITTLGYGDVHPVTFPEYFYTIFAIFLGAACYAIIIAAMGAHLVASRFAAKAEYNRYADSLVAYEQYHTLPTALRKRIEAYCDHIWKRRKSFLNDNVVRTLPRSMREAISEAIYFKIIHDSPVLRGCISPGFVDEFMTLFRPQGVALPGQVLFAVDEPITTIFFIRRGRVEIRALVEVENADLVVALRGDGQYCGDQGLFSSSSQSPAIPSGSDSSVSQQPAEAAVVARHEVSAVVADFGDVYIVMASDLLTLLRRFPYEAALFELVAKERRLAIEEVLRLYETTPEMGSNDGKGWPWARASRGRRWHDIWRAMVAEAADDALVAQALQSTLLSGVRALRNVASVDFTNDVQQDKGFVIPRAIGGIYRRFQGAAPPVGDASSSGTARITPWGRKRLPVHRVQDAEFTGDVYERIEALEAQNGELLDLCRRMDARLTELHAVQLDNDNKVE